MLAPAARHAALVYLGSLLGAGFASGQELQRFFGIFGAWGLLGAAAAGLGLGLGGMAVSHRAARVRATSFGELMGTLPRVVAGAFYFTLSLFLFGGLSIMLAAGGALAVEQLHLARTYGILLMAVATVVCCWWRTEGLVKASSLLVPPMLVCQACISLVGLLSARQPCPETMATPLSWVGRHWWWATALYVGYNLLGGIAVLPPLNELGRSARWGALLGGLALGVAALVCVAALQVSCAGGDLPFLTIARRLGKSWSWVYALNLALACLTTSAADLFSLAQARRHYRLRLLAIVTLALPLAFLPFPSLVGRLYPAFGYIGLLLILLLLLGPLATSVTPRQRPPRRR